MLLGVVFYDAISNYFNFTFTDELLTLFIFFYWLCYKKKNTNREFLFFIIIVCLYLIYSLLYPNNVYRAIFTDFFIQIKPFIVFYSVYGLKLQISNYQAKKIQSLCKRLSICFFPVGLLFLFGYESSLRSIFGHPSRYASFYQIIGIVYLIYSAKNKSDFLMSLLIMSPGLFGGRSKTFGFLAAYVYLIFFRERMSIKNIITPKNLITVSILVLSIIYAAWDKIYFYFIHGSQGEELFARPALYLGALDILNDYPFMGSGLGTYACYASAVYYSPLYVRYGLWTVNGLDEGGSFIADTYFPTLAQFGYIGIFLFILFWFKRILEARRMSILSHNNIDFIIPLLIVIFFFIESLADSTFVQNRGMAMMMFLAISLSKSCVVKSCFH